VAVLSDDAAAGRHDDLPAVWRRLRDRVDPAAAARWRQEVRRLSGAVTPRSGQVGLPDDLAAGLVVGLAYPQRLARVRRPGAASYLTAGGTAACRGHPGPGGHSGVPATHRCARKCADATPASHGRKTRPYRSPRICTDDAAAEPVRDVHNGAARPRHDDIPIRAYPSRRCHPPVCHRTHHATERAVTRVEGCQERVLS
jgi:hypothetical protein